MTGQRSKCLCLESYLPGSTHVKVGMSCVRSVREVLHHALYIPPLPCTRSRHVNSPNNQTKQNNEANVLQCVVPDETFSTPACHLSRSPRSAYSLLRYLLAIRSLIYSSMWTFANPDQSCGCCFGARAKMPNAAKLKSWRGHARALQWFPKCQAHGCFF